LTARFHIILTAIVFPSKFSERIFFSPKYIGEHTDVIGGCVTTRTRDHCKRLKLQQLTTGMPCGPFQVLHTHYPGLPSHPIHVAAKTFMKKWSGMIAFDVGSAQAAIIVAEVSPGGYARTSLAHLPLFSQCDLSFMRYHREEQNLLWSMLCRYQTTLSWSPQAYFSSGNLWGKRCLWAYFVPNKTDRTVDFCHFYCWNRDCRQPHRRSIKSPRPHLMATFTGGEFSRKRNKNPALMS
ncbi:hypothetical protein GCK32_011378, partial [Trichostrongylus colubriformis]